MVFTALEISELLFPLPSKLSDSLIKQIFGNFLMTRHKVDFQGLILPV